MFTLSLWKQFYAPLRSVWAQAGCVQFCDTLCMFVDDTRVAVKKKGAQVKLSLQTTSSVTATTTTTPTTTANGTNSTPMNFKANLNTLPSSSNTLQINTAISNTFTQTESKDSKYKQSLDVDDNYKTDGLIPPDSTMIVSNYSITVTEFNGNDGYSTGNESGADNINNTNDNNNNTRNNGEIEASASIYSVTKSNSNYNKKRLTSIGSYTRNMERQWKRTEFGRSDCGLCFINCLCSSNFKYHILCLLINIILITGLVLENIIDAFHPAGSLVYSIYMLIFFLF